MGTPEEKIFGCQGKILDKQSFFVYDRGAVKERSLTGEDLILESLEMTLLFDYYGELLTQRQRDCLDMRYNQDMSLGEIAQELGVSRQGVFDTLNRAETLLRNMEEKTGFLRRDEAVRRAAQGIRQAAEALNQMENPEVVRLAGQILTAAKELEE